MMRTILFLFVFLLHSVFCNAIKYEYKEGLGLYPSWVRWDMCVGYCESKSPTSRMVLFLYQVDDDGEYGELSGSYYSMIEDNYYLVYGPYDAKHQNKKRTELKVTYAGQAQTENGVADNIYKYDFMAARSWVTTTQADFVFNHFGSVLRVEFPARRDMKVTELVMSTAQNHFATDATINLDENTLTPTAYLDSMMITVDSLQIEKEDTFVAYVMVPPTDFSGDTILVKLKSDDGTIATARVRGCNVKPGLMYRVRATGEPGEESEEELNAEGQEVEGEEGSSSEGAKATASQVTDSDNANQTGQLVPFPEATLSDGQFRPMAMLAGDVNGDGMVTMGDANMVINIYLTGNTIGADILAADINEDGQISMSDANQIVNIFLAAQ